MVAARAPDVTSFSGGGPTGWTLEGFYSFFAGPSSAFLHQPARTHVPAREPGARVEPVDGKGVTITVGLGVCLRSSAGPGPTEPVHRRDARPSRVQAAAALRTLLLVCTSSCSSAENAAMAIPRHRREVPFRSPFTVTSTLLRSTAGFGNQISSGAWLSVGLPNNGPLAGLDVADFRATPLLFRAHCFPRSGIQR